jgi:hypothetical protein
VSKKTPLSNELFKNKAIPNFIRDHSLFKNPVKVGKIFPYIGLPNFCDKIQIEKTLADLTKEGSYVFNVMRTMSEFAAYSAQQSHTMADRLQYLENKEIRDENREKTIRLYELTNVLNDVVLCTDPYNGGVLTNTIMMTDEKKCVLKLYRDITDASGKAIFRKGDTLFSIFNRIKNDTTNLSVVSKSLEQSPAFKAFSKENIPNKEFQIVFSSEGEEGAWDIATMSMRGIKSCQRWDGEYPKCLIGSILSKFVGIIYLTSGVAADDQPNYSNLGTKMMRRAVVRYVINADERSPAIIIDKMYPELDKHIAAAFVESIQKRTNLPVHLAHELGNKLRHFYLPSEKIRDQISDREWSYQDNPIKSKNELNVYTLFNNKESIEQELDGFSIKLQLFLSRKMEDDLASIGTNIEIKKTLSILKMHAAFSAISKLLTQSIIEAFKAPNNMLFTNGKSYYRKYLIEFLMKRKSIFSLAEGSISQVIQSNSSRSVDMKAFIGYISKISAEFVKHEAISLSN